MSSYRVEGDAIVVRPDVCVCAEIGRMIFGGRIRGRQIAVKSDGHVGEGGGRDQVARFANRGRNGGRVQR